MKLFVTGTDTNVGKTFISAILAKGLQASYWKPVQSGIDPITDSQWVRKHTNLPDSFILPESYLLKLPLSPHASAALQKKHISLDDIRIPPYSTEHLIVEGAGGVLVPLNESCMVIDLVQKLMLPTIIVARSTLGTINHTLLTLEALRSRNIPILGVILNGVRNPFNKTAIEKYGNVRIIAEMEPIKQIYSDLFQELFNEKFRGGYLLPTAL